MGGIPGLVYRSIETGYSVAGVGVRVAQHRVTPPADAVPAAAAERETALAILNGVWGDHLEASGNPLAIRMSLRLAGVPLLVEGAPQVSERASLASWGAPLLSGGATDGGRARSRQARCRPLSRRPVSGCSCSSTASA